MSAPSHKSIPHHIDNDDEIDLLALLNTLWVHKFLILIITTIGFWGACGLSLLIKEEWRSTAVVVAPRLANTEKFIEINRAVQRITNTDEDIKVNELMEQVFSTFLYTAADNDEKHNYLKNTELFQRQMSDESTNPGTLLNTLSQNLSVQLPDAKAQSLTTSYTLSFVSDRASSAQEVLSGYIDNINRIAVETSQKEFSNSLTAMISARKQQIQDIEIDVKNTRQVMIDDYSKALLTAQKAGIKSSPNSLSGYSETGNHVVLEINPNPQQLYLQGEEILQALLEVARNEPLSYPATYYRLQYEIDALTPFLQEQPSFQSFSFLMRPTLPSKRQAPKRAQMAVIGGLLGGVLSCLYVLVAAAFRNRRKALA